MSNSTTVNNQNLGQVESGYYLLLPFDCKPEIATESRLMEYARNLIDANRDDEDFANLDHPKNVADAMYLIETMLEEEVFEIQGEDAIVHWNDPAEHEYEENDIDIESTNGFHDYPLNMKDLKLKVLNCVIENVDESDEISGCVRAFCSKDANIEDVVEFAEANDAGDIVIKLKDEQGGEAEVYLYELSSVALDGLDESANQDGYDFELGR
jgi:hypothetical protein